MSNKKWIDAKGREIPDSRVTEEEKKRERMVARLTKKAKKLNEEIVRFKAEAAKDINKHLDDFAQEYGSDKWKGNAMLYNFGRTAMVERRERERIDFTAELQLAHQKSIECVKRWSKGANKNLQITANEAFQTDKDGKVNQRKILELLRWPIEDPEWDSVKKLIQKSIRVVDTKVYYSFHQLNGDDELKAIDLNFSSVK